MRHTEPLTKGTIALAMSPKSFTPLALLALMVAWIWAPTPLPDEVDTESETPVVDTEVVETEVVETEVVDAFNVFK